MTVNQLSEELHIDGLQLDTPLVKDLDIHVSIANVILLLIVIIIVKSLNSKVGERYVQILCFSSTIGILLQIYSIAYGALKSCGSYMLTCVTTINGIIAYVSGMGIDMSGLLIAGTMEIPLASEAYVNLSLSLFSPCCVIGLCSCISGTTGQGSISAITGGIGKFIGWTFGTLTTILVAFINATCKVVGNYGNIAIKGAQLSVGTISPTYGKDLGEMSSLVFDSLNAIASTAGNMVLTSVISLAAVPLIRALLLIGELKLMSFLLEELSGTKTITNGISAGSIAISIMLSVSICTILMSSSLCGIIERLSR